jgi:hypothetical protein
MAFTYIGDLSTDRDSVRFYLQDVTDGSGPRPGDANFSDAEIDGLISLAGSWQRAVAAALDALAVAWRRYPTFKADGLSLNRTDIANGFEAQAKEWRQMYGITTPARVAGIIRIDGYSDDIASDDVDTTSEYGGIGLEYVRVSE